MNKNNINDRLILKNFHSLLFITLCVITFIGCDRTQCRIILDDPDVSMTSDTIEADNDTFVSVNAEFCSDTEQNVCGGDELLFFEPGDPCGSCSRTHWQCEETNFVCSGDCSCELDADCAENEWCSNNICVDETWAYIPTGTFIMGSPDDEIGRYYWEQEQHRVILTQPFLLSRYELTIGEWRMISEIPVRDCGENNPSCSEEIPDDYEVLSEDCNPYPINGISWFEAIEYINARSEQEGLELCYMTEEISYQHVIHWNRDCLGYRLPTEAEWEYAARAGTTTATHQGNLTLVDDEILSPLVGYEWCEEEGPLPEIECSNRFQLGFRYNNPQLPGLLIPNSWGLYDTLGNVPEYVWDESSHDFTNIDIDPPSYNSSQANARVARGGIREGSNEYCRFTFRGGTDFDWSYYIQGVGIRLARSLPISQ